MSLTKISEKFVLNKLKNISQGNLKLINYDGKVFHFGDLESKLSTDIKINNPSFYLNVILGGSSALGEAHIKRAFYTTNLTNLIELNARNINADEFQHKLCSAEPSNNTSFINELNGGTLFINEITFDLNIIFLCISSLLRSKNLNLSLISSG